jgi:hypothetical protein
LRRSAKPAPIAFAVAHPFRGVAFFGRPDGKVLKKRGNLSFRGAQRREPLALRAFGAENLSFCWLLEEGFLASLEMTVPRHNFLVKINLG